jgi:hypothetical protein
MVRRRYRTLSVQGLELFCDSMNINSDTNKYIESKKNCKNLKIYEKLKVKHKQIKQFLQNIFSSDYDKQLETNIKTMRNSTLKLLSYINETKKIPEFTNNAITNLVALILSDGEKSINKQKVKYNLGFYLDLAKNALNTNDHQTAILIKAAIANTNITRLKIKYNKKQKETIELLNKEYGGFMDCHRNHLKKIIDNSSNFDWLPSLMVLHMHLNKIKDYSKAFKNLGRNTSELSNVSDQLKLAQSNYYKWYKDTDKSLVHLYEKDPFDLVISKKLKQKNDKMNSIHELLYTLSTNIDGKKKRNTI